VPIADILAHYGLLDILEESSQGYEGACPFCGSGSFKVNVERNVWFCFGDCKEEAEGRGARNGGNILDFVSRKEGVSVKCAAQKIAGWFPKDGGTAGTKESKPTAVAHAKGEQAPEPIAKPAGEGQGSAAPHSATSAPAEASGDKDLEKDLPEDLTGRSNAPLAFTLAAGQGERKRRPVVRGRGRARTDCRSGAGDVVSRSRRRESVRASDTPSAICGRCGAR
jgi:hypothetical protein